MKEFTFKDIREHRSVDDGWIAVHGKVYDISSFISRHPGEQNGVPSVVIILIVSGGRVIITSLGRDATALFETHHNLVENIQGVEQMLSKFQIGIVKDYKPVARFDSPFAKKLLESVRAKVKGVQRRESWYSHSAIMALFASFSLAIFFAFKTAHYMLCPLLGKPFFCYVF